MINKIQNKLLKYKTCQKIRSKRKYILPIIFTLISLVLFLIYKNISNKPLQNEKNYINDDTNKNIVTSNIEKTTKSININTLGIIKGKNEVNLSFKEGGKISKIYFEEGDFVKQGSLIALTTSEEQQINLEFQKLMSDQKYDIKDLTKKYYDRLINNAKYQLEQAHEDLPSGDSKDITIEQLENAVKTYKELRNLNTDNAELSSIAQDLQKKLANVSVNNTRIYAPYDGYIIKKYFEESEIAPTATPVIHFVSKDLVIKSSVVVEDAKKINLNTKVIANYNNTSNDLYVSKIYPNINEQNRLVDIEVKITGTLENLFFNEIVPIQFELEQKDLLKVDKSALYYDYDGIYITNIQNNKIKVQKILEDKNNIYIPYSQDLEGTLVLH